MPKNCLDRRNGLQKLHAVLNDLQLNDLQLKIRELSDIENISIDHVHYIFHDDLGMANLSARCVPRLLYVEKNTKQWIFLMKVWHSLNAIPLIFLDDLQQ